MPQLQFDAKVTSKDGTMLLYIRGPFNTADGPSFQFKVFPVTEMREWTQIWKDEEVSGGQSGTHG